MICLHENVFLKKKKGRNEINFLEAKIGRISAKAMVMLLRGERQRRITKKGWISKPAWAAPVTEPPAVPEAVWSNPVLPRMCRCRVARFYVPPSFHFRPMGERIIVI